jgi:hypothetical protein
VPKNVPEKIDFLNDELTGLRSRMAGEPNATQRQKLEMWTDIRDDYAKSMEAARKREEAA